MSCRIASVVDPDSNLDRYERCMSAWTGLPTAVGTASGRAGTRGSQRPARLDHEPRTRLNLQTCWHPTSSSGFADICTDCYLVRIHRQFATGLGVFRQIMATLQRLYVGDAAAGAWFGRSGSSTCWVRTACGVAASSHGDPTADGVGNSMAPLHRYMRLRRSLAECASGR